MPSGKYKHYKHQGFQKGSPPTTGSFKKGHKINLGKKNGWKDGSAWKVSLHHWIENEKGKAKNYKCVDCNNKARDWSNIDHKYKNVLGDYMPRCRKCHIRWDIKFNNKKVGRYKKLNLCQKKKKN
jgi:NAD-dependent SIR2 family protein deacetylase